MAALSLATAGVLLAISIDKWYTIGHQFETAFDPSQGSMLDRWKLAGHSMEMIMEHP